MKRHARQDVATLRRALRQRLPPIDEARIYERLLEQDHAGSQRKLAEKLGVSQTRISQRIALLAMPRAIVSLLERPGSGFTERHARAIRKLPDLKSQIALAQRVAHEQLAVAETEDIVAEMCGLRSMWSRTPGVRWRRSAEGIELHVTGQTRAEQVRALKRFLATFRG